MKKLMSTLALLTVMAASAFAQPIPRDNDLVYSLQQAPKIHASDVGSGGGGA